MMLRHLLSILVLPGLAAGVVPQWIRESRIGRDTQWMDGTPLAWSGRTLGMLLLAAGIFLFGWCVVLFARVGRGTLAPWDPTQRLVAVGPYRFVRNPMISGVATILVAQALLAGSIALAIWAATFILINHVYFLASEEPGLERRFGDSYRAYKAAVPRWLPSLRRSRAS